MKIYELKHNVWLYKDTASKKKEMLHVVLFVLIVCAITFACMWIYTSDPNYCKRVSDIKVKEKLGCPILIAK